MDIGDPIWVSGTDKSGMHTKKGRKALFMGYLQNGCCLIKYTDIPFRKGGIDTQSVTCLVSNISAR
jgi:hypothetical protein